MAISKIQNISKEELTRIEKVIGESFVTNELFHNWGTIEERRSSVLAYMKIYVDCVYRAGELYGNETLTGFVGIEDTRRPATAAKINMLFKMIFMLPLSKIKSLMHFIKQIHSSNAEYAKEPHLDILLVCVDKEHQGKGIATELVDFAKKMSDDKGLRKLELITKIFKKRIESGSLNDVNDKGQYGLSSKEQITVSSTTK